MGLLVKILFAAILIGGAILIGVRPLVPPKKIADFKVNMPALSTLAEIGRVAFDVNCAQCHGKNGSGTNGGPPLIDNVYNSGHHGDAVFVLAIKAGVRQHHWRFGDMPAQPQVPDEQMVAIVQFVREVQAANGVGGQSPRM
jgi:mono/diheme cytochrome c family protein